MKKIKFAVLALTLTLTAASFNPANAEDKGKKEYIENFTAGRKLNSADIKFLNSISTNSGKGDAKSAMVNGVGFKEGQTINQSDADVINKAKDQFRKGHKLAKATDAKKIDKTRGNENCYWYLYCDGYGNCYYIWYCD